MPGGPGCAQLGGPGSCGTRPSRRSPPRRGNPIHGAIADHFVLPVDLLIRSYETFATYLPNPNSMLSRMLEDSEVLYDRRAACYSGRHPGSVAARYRRLGPFAGSSANPRWLKGPVVRPGSVRLDVSEPLLVLPQHLAPIVSAGFDVVLLNQVPDDLLQRDSPCREMQA